MTPRTDHRKRRLPQRAAAAMRGLVALGLVAALSPLANAVAADATVRITDTLQPRDLVVAVGTTVAWVNEDADRHRIRTEEGPEDFDSGNLEPGQSFSFNFAFAGTYRYVDDRDRDDPAYHGTVTVTTEVPDPGEPPPPPPTSGDVEIIDDSFRPATLNVAAGATVRWVNQDREHTVTARDRSWDSGIFDVGGTYERTFPAAGTFEYFCLIHPDMVGTVVVGDGGGGGGEPNPPPTEEPPPPPPPPPPGDADVTIVDFDFAPGSLTVPAGTTVRWINAGDAPHTVTRNGAFDSGFLFTGDAYQRAFPVAGTFDYFCTLHPDMVGTVVVTGPAGEPPPPADEPPPPEEEPSPPADPPPPSGGGDVTIVDNAFRPGTYRVPVGGAVRWVNSGALPHTVTRNGAFDSGFLFPGDSYRRTFAAAGTYDYFCTLHPGMAGTIVVGAGGTPPPPADGDGGDETSGGDPPPPPPPPPGAADVVMVDNAFAPQRVEVVTGQSVAWRNTGALPHTATAADGSFDSGFVLPGDVFTRTFATPGTFDYFCSIHPGMSGVIVVTGEAVTVGDEARGDPPPATALDPPSPAGEPEATAAADDAVAAAAPRTIARVRVVDNAYEPPTLTIEAGDAVRWVNTGLVPHTVTSEEEGAFDSGFLNGGDDFVRAFDEPGTFAYFCTLHPEMTGVIEVVAPAPPAPTAAAPLLATTAGTAPLPLGVAVLLAGSIVIAMAAFAFGMARFGAAAERQR